MNLSIIITCYHQHDIIHNMIARLNRPEGRDEDYEIIIADDTDMHIGCGGQRNRAVGYARGEWIWFVDGDDVIMPDAIGRVLDALDTDAPAVVIPYDVHDVKTAEVSPVRISPASLKLWEVGVTAWSKVIRREDFVPFREAMSEDADWWLKQARRLCVTHGSSSFSVVPGDACLVYNQNAGGSFMDALNRFYRAHDREDAARVLLEHPETARAYAACLRSFAEIIEISSALREPREMRDFCKFFITEWMRMMFKEQR